MTRAVSVVTLLASLIAVAPAAATESASIQTTLNADGAGQLIVNSQLNPNGETWSWQACAPDGSGCTPFASGRLVSTVGAGAGTIFKASANDGPTASSPVWHGTVASTGSPGVSGAVRANALVTPVAGSWSGGWDGDEDITQLAACVNADGTDCTTLTNTHYPQGCPNGAAVLDPVFTGQYLRVADQRIAKDSVFADYAVSSPYGHEVWPAATTTSVDVLGQIAPATGSRAAACGPPPLTEGASPTKPSPPPPDPGLPRKSCGRRAAAPPCVRSVSATLSHGGVARVHCQATCEVVLSARRGSLHVHLTRRLHGPTTVTLRLAARRLRKLGGGRATFSVAVDGAPRAVRSVNLH